MSKHDSVIDAEATPVEPSYSRNAGKPESGGKYVKTKQDIKRELKEKRKAERKERGGFGRRIKETGSELKKVSWPRFRQVVKKTSLVIAVVLFFLLVIYGFDQLLSLLYGLLTRGL